MQFVSQLGNSHNDFLQNQLAELTYESVSAAQEQQPCQVVEVLKFQNV
jgi:hypothetical protein